MSEDLIRREDALEAIDAIESEVADGDGFQYEKWRKYFSDLPSAQPEIIRCKDCKHNQGSCCDYSAVYVRPHGYCQWGERRTND